MFKIVVISYLQFGILSSLNNVSFVNFHRSPLIAHTGTLLQIQCMHKSICANVLNCLKHVASCSSSCIFIVFHFFFGWFLVLLMLDLRSLFFLEGLSFCIFNSTLGIWSINDKLEDELLGIFYFRVETWVYDSFVLLLVSIPIDGAVVKFIFSPWYPTQISFVVYVLKY